MQGPFSCCELLGLFHNVVGRRWRYIVRMPAFVYTIRNSTEFASHSEDELHNQSEKPWIFLHFSMRL